MFRTRGIIFRKTIVYACISISSTVGRRVCFEHTVLLTRFYIAYSWPSNIHALCISCFFSYLLLVGLYYLYFTIMMTVKRKIHSVPLCIVFAFPVKNYLFFCHKFSTRPLWAFVCLEHLWSWRREQEEQKNRNFWQGNYRRYIHYGLTKYYGRVSSDTDHARHSRQFWKQDKACGGKEEDQVTGNGVSWVCFRV